MWKKQQKSLISTYPRGHTHLIGGSEIHTRNSVYFCPVGDDFPVVSTYRNWLFPCYIKPRTEHPINLGTSDSTLNLLGSGAPLLPFQLFFYPRYFSSMTIFYVPPPP